MFLSDSLNYIPDEFLHEFIEYTTSYSSGFMVYGGALVIGGAVFGAFIGVVFLFCLKWAFPFFIKFLNYLEVLFKKISSSRRRCNK